LHNLDVCGFILLTKWKAQPAYSSDCDFVARLDNCIAQYVTYFSVGSSEGKLFLPIRLRGKLAVVFFAIVKEVITFV
jgi:hypothetical protein